MVNVNHGNDVPKQSVQFLKRTVRESNEGRKEAERNGELSIGYVTGCADCWTYIDRLRASEAAEGHNNYACPFCGSDNLVGQLDE